MKTILFAAALLAATGASAQQPTQPTPQDQIPASERTAPTPPPAQGVATWPTADNPRPSNGDYPPCSRTVTDHCIERR